MSDFEKEYILELTKSLHGLKSNAEKAMLQISDEQMHVQPNQESNSVAILIKHMSGNMISRFTDFLSSDGEKPWRKRDEEFIEDFLTRDQLKVIWEKGWQCLFDCVHELKDSDLQKTVYIREEAHTVLRALQRQLTHYAYHTGQIVYLCKLIRSTEFKSLSIPRRKSSEI